MLGGGLKSIEKNQDAPPQYVCLSSQQGCCVSGEDEGELRHVAPCRLLTAWSHLPPPARARGGRCGLGGPRRVTSEAGWGQAPERLGPLGTACQGGGGHVRGVRSSARAGGWGRSA